MIDTDGQNGRALNTQPSMFVGNPVWSPDGTKIAFNVFPFGNASQEQIWVTDLAGNAASITTNAQAQDPQWSPDGTKILFTSSRTGNLDVFTMDSSGANQTNLTHRAGDDTAARWSPDGNSIVFTGGFNLWRMNSDGSGDQAITSGMNTQDTEPAWISNNQIVYHHFTSPMNQLYVTNPQGANQHIFSPSTNPQGTPVPSPDGKFLAWYEQDQNSNNQIYYTALDTIASVRITKSSHTNDLAAWQSCQ